MFLLATLTEHLPEMGKHAPAGLASVT
jgi:hypothetical protein